MDLTEDQSVGFVYGPSPRDRFVVTLERNGRLSVLCPGASVAVRPQVSNHVEIEAVDRT